MSVLPCQARRSCRAFSLIELLSVMAVIGMMAVAAVPAMNSIKGGNNLSKAASDISGVLEQARSYAMANNTYVFVGITEVNVTNSESAKAQSAGTGRVVIVAAGSRDGTRSFGTGNANLVPLSKPLRFDNTHLDDSVPNTGNLSRPSVDAAFQVGNSAFAAENSFQWPLAGSSATYTFTKIIQFDPRGAATIQSSSRNLPQWLEIGLAPTHGTALASTSDRAALLLDGVTGSINIYRP